MLRLTFIPALILLLIGAPVFGADLSTEFGIGAGYTDNLFNDSSGASDSYTSPFLKLSIYPSSSLEVSLSGSYNSYAENGDLSSTSAGGAITYVGVDEKRPLALYLSAGSSMRRYGDLYGDYDYFQNDVAASSRYRLARDIHIKLGGALSSSDYTNTESGDNYGYGIFGGVNAGLWGSNTVDIEGGIDFTRFTGLDEATVRGWRNAANQNDIASDLQTAYFSLRFSRPIGSHSGLSLEYAGRLFVGDDNVVTYGLSLDNLSPWTAFWEGQAALVEVKSYLLPNFILTGGVRYREARFMDALEVDNPDDPVTYSLQSREDDRMQTFFVIQRSFFITPGQILKPSVNFSYVDNNSTHPYYDYSSMAMSLTLNFQF